MWRDRNAPLPPNWAMDKEARPTTDPHKAAYARPMGDYKGYGLSFMIECLGALLAGDPQVAPVLKAGVKDPRHYENGAVCAIDIGAFTDVRQFRLNVDELVSTIKAQPKAEGSTEIFVPGEIEERRRAQRLKDGIPLPEPTYKRLMEVARRFDIQPPQVDNQ
jgi:ureidoglycolate dehydrogenase (NAD+)